MKTIGRKLMPICVEQMMNVSAERGKTLVDEHLTVIEKPKNLSVLNVSSTCRGTILCHWKTKFLNKQKEKKFISKFTVGIFEIEIRKSAVATAFEKS